MTAASFQNFDLELSGYVAEPDGRVRFRVRAAETPRAQVQSIDAADQVNIAAGEVDRVVTTLANRWDVAESDFAGACRSLEQWLLPAPSRARSLLESSLSGLSADDVLLLRIRCTNENLARLPWEFATFDVAGLGDDGHFHADRTLAMHPQVCLVRFDELTAPVEFRREERQPRLLFVNAAPPDLDALALSSERTRIEEALAKSRTKPDSTWLEHVTVEGLQRALRDARLDVFQYSGHGGSSRGGFLCFEADQGGDGTFAAANLGLLLAGKGVRVAVLAACVTAEIEIELPWSSVARALVTGGVPAVVGMQLNISDESAVAFLSTFYETLAASMPIGTALKEARKSIVIRPELDRDFGVPVLYLRNAGAWDGRVFPLPRAETADERKIRAADAYKRLHDSLHKAKMDAFHLILRFANDFPPKSTFNRGPLRSYVNTIRVCVNEMRNIAAEGHCDDELINPLIDALAQATAQLESAIANWDRDTFVDALPQLNSVFSREMAMLDVSLHNTTKELPVSEALRNATGRDLVEFRQLIEEMKLRVVTHHACQRLENLLDDMRDLRSADTVNVGTLKRRRQELKSLLDSCFEALDKDTAASLLRRCTMLDESLTSPDAEQLAMAYDDFCAEVGMSFYKIDSELKGMCARLCTDPRLTSPSLQ